MLGKKPNNSDDLPATEEEWKSRIAHRNVVVKQARQSGDPTFIGRAVARRDAALDGYNRDTK
ncbi:hypothetical protein [Streptomyces sp. NPDC004579]|uniref:hypothetical protein n=1 Tax=Streptomyces sp. NPDC004579 TaxID=3154667 RepID=UPI0033B082B9